MSRKVRARVCGGEVSLPSASTQIDCGDLTSGAGVLRSFTDPLHPGDDVGDDVSDDVGDDDPAQGEEPAADQLRVGGAANGPGELMPGGSLLPLRCLPSAVRVQDRAAGQ